MALTEYTSHDDVRAALGVTAEELEDATLSLPLYSLDLVSDLEDVSANLATDFTDLPADPGTWTSLQRRFDSATRLFATYSVAKHLTVALPLFAPKEVTDGKATTSRYAADPYKQTIEGVLSMYDKYRQRLADTYAALSSTSAAVTAIRTYMAVSSPSSDPVTGS